MRIVTADAECVCGAQTHPPLIPPSFIARLAGWLAGCGSSMKVVKYDDGGRHGGA